VRWSEETPGGAKSRSTIPLVSSADCTNYDFFSEICSIRHHVLTFFTFPGDRERQDSLAKACSFTENYSEIFRASY